jgi:hypothetical protein
MGQSRRYMEPWMHCNTPQSLIKLIKGFWITLRWNYLVPFYEWIRRKQNNGAIEIDCESLWENAKGVNPNWCTWENLLRSSRLVALCLRADLQRPPSRWSWYCTRGWLAPTNSRETKVKIWFQNVVSDGSLTWRDTSCRRSPSSDAGNLANTTSNGRRTDSTQMASGCLIGCPYVGQFFWHAEESSVSSLLLHSFTE